MMRDEKILRDNLKIHILVTSGTREKLEKKKKKKKSKQAVHKNLRNSNNC